VGKDNLKPFKKGQSGNPKGRPKLPDLTEVISEELGQKGYNEIIAKLHKMAKAGHTRAAEILLDRGYGKPKQEIEHGVSTDKPFIFVVKPDKE